MIKKCIGCGVALQSQEKEKLGFTPDIKKDYCMRCFRLKNYGEVSNNEQVDEDKILTKVNKAYGIAFFFLDYLNINEFTLAIFKKIKIKKVLVISKVDTLRKDMKFLKIKKWLSEEYAIYDDILFVSSKTGYGINSIFHYADKVGIHTFYVLGITNAGKSTFINRLLEENHLSKEIVTSNKPNTTLDFIKLSISGYLLFDTPGFSYPNMSSNLIGKEIKPITFNLKREVTLHVSDYAIYFSYPTSITCYFSGKENLKRDNEKITGKVLHLKRNQDIVLPGYGFINVKESGDVIINENKNVEVRNSISGVVYE